MATITRVAAAVFGGAPDPTGTVKLSVLAANAVVIVPSETSTREKMPLRRPLSTTRYKAGGLSSADFSGNPGQHDPHHAFKSQFLHESFLYAWLHRLQRSDSSAGVAAQGCPR